MDKMNKAYAANKAAAAATGGGGSSSSAEAASGDAKKRPQLAQQKLPTAKQAKKRSRMGPLRVRLCGCVAVWLRTGYVKRCNGILEALKCIHTLIR